MITLSLLVLFQNCSEVAFNAINEDVAELSSTSVSCSEIPEECTNGYGGIGVLACNADRKDSDVFVFDGGECTVGIESTIVGIDGSTKRFSILRKGVISGLEIGGYLAGYSESSKEDYLPSEFHVPGGDDKHYRPELPLIVDVMNTPLEAVRAQFNIHSNAKFLEIHLSKDPFLAARSVYKELYLAGKNPQAYILVRVPKYNSAESMVWEAVLDRLRRAATHTIA